MTSQPNAPETAAEAPAQMLPSARLRSVADLGVRIDMPVEHLVAATALLRAYRVVTQRADAALEPYDLTMSRLEILGYLGASEEGTLSFRELRSAALLHSASLTYLFDQLESRKLVRRRKDPVDRRAYLAEITASGRSLLATAMRALREELFGIGDLPASECVALTQLLVSIPGFDETRTG